MPGKNKPIKILSKGDPLPQSISLEWDICCDIKNQADIVKSPDENADGPPDGIVK